MVEDVQSAPAALALQPVRRVGDKLQLLEHELGNDQRALDEARVAEVGDAPVDDDARIQDLVAPAEALLLEEAEEVGGVEPLRFLRPDQEPDVRQEDEEKDPDEGRRRRIGADLLVDRPERPAEKNPGVSADRRAPDDLKLGPPDAGLQVHDDGAGGEGRRRAGQPRQAEDGEEVAGRRDAADDEKSENKNAHRTASFII